MRLGQLCRTLPARGRAIRAELPESQVGACGEGAQKGPSLERPSFFPGSEVSLVQTLSMGTAKAVFACLQSKLCRYAWVCSSSSLLK